MKSTSSNKPAVKSGIFYLGGDLPVYRLGFGSMQLTGKGVWNEPADHKDAYGLCCEQFSARPPRARL